MNGRFPSFALHYVGPYTMRSTPRDAVATNHLLGYYPPLR